VVCANVNDSGLDRIAEASVDIAAWLRDLGLEQYEPAFRANEIDEGVLPNLTSEDLSPTSPIRPCVLRFLPSK
jgi:hypothetical protein